MKSEGLAPHSLTRVTTFTHALRFRALTISVISDTVPLSVCSNDVRKKLRTPSASPEGTLHPKRRSAPPTRTVLVGGVTLHQVKLKARGSSSKLALVNAGVLQLSINSGEGQQQQASDEDNEQRWTTVRSSRARHQQPHRPKFMLSNLGNPGSAYHVIIAFQKEPPNLRMEVRPTLQSE